MSRIVFKVYLERGPAKRLEELARYKGLSKSSVVGAAVASFLSPDTAERREAAIGKRLDKLTRQFDVLERDQTILIETVALYVRYYLSVTLPVADEHQEAARAQGRARFEQFVQQLSGHLQRGHSLVREVHEDLYADASQFLDADGTRPSKTSEAPA